jgi:hypothetical protein
VVRAETLNREGKSEEQQARIREVKVGWVLAYTAVYEKGYPNLQGRVLRPDGRPSQVSESNSRPPFIHLHKKGHSGSIGKSRKIL